MDAFDRWNLPENATDNQIKTTYRKLVQKMHPDRIGSTPKTQEDFCQLQEDYEILKDPVKRRELIEKRQKPQPQPQPQPKTTSSTSSFVKQSVSPIKNNEIFVPASPIHAQVTINLNQVWLGGVLNLVVLSSRPCICKRNLTCPKCSGTGQVFFKKLVEVPYPSGVLNNSEIIIHGGGHEGTFENGPLKVTFLWGKTFNWVEKNGFLNYYLKIPKLFYKPGIKVFIKAPSGKLGSFVINSITNDYTILQIPNLGFLKGEVRDRVFVHIIKRSNWLLPIFYINQTYIKIKSVLKNIFV